MYIYIYLNNQAATGLDRTVLVSQVSRTTLKPMALIRSARDINGVRSRPLGMWVMCSPGQLIPWSLTSLPGKKPWRNAKKMENLWRIYGLCIVNIWIIYG